MPVSTSSRIAVEAWGRTRVKRVLSRITGGSGSRAAVSSLTLGTVASQLVLLVASIALARLFSPQDFGEFSVALAVAVIVAVVATLGFEAAIPLADNDEEAVAVARLALVCAAATSSLVTVVLVAAPSLVTGSRSRLALGPIVWTIPPTVLAIAAWNSLRLLQSRAGRFSRISVSGVAGSVVQSLGQLVAGLLGGGAVWLGLGYLAGRAANVASMAGGSRLTWPFGTPWLLAGTARRWRRFPLYLTLPSALNALSVGAVAPIVALVYGVTFSGSFAFATRILAVPSALLGQAVATVFYPRAAAMERRGEDTAALIQRTTTSMLMLAVPAFGIVLLLGPEMFQLVFGSQWREAGSVAAVLAPWLALSFVSSPLSAYATVKDQLGRLLALSLVETVLRLGALYAGVFVAPLWGVAGYSGVGVLISGCYVAWILHLAGSGLGAWTSTVRGYLVVVLVAYPACRLTKYHLPTAAYVGVSLVLTLGLLVCAGRQLRRARPPMVRSDPAARGTAMGARRGEPGDCVGIEQGGKV